MNFVCIRTGLLNDANRLYSRTVTRLIHPLEVGCSLSVLWSIGTSAGFGRGHLTECCAKLTILTAFGIHAEFLPDWQITRNEGY